ncbi:NUDIX domain-containing protein [Aliivibrio sp. S10_S31]|uniref:NUDIX domain-containing protein n=1 Tax=Aliivibrio sp. S10_S31 TaxID=2720224 RepID=UPI001680EBA0|nr:NUDIX domain-containing protein [Aliivibrio sp. S10_S31]MBD1570311.1 NUDIX domain-containing protein [Aliivibrio sp. S10_S31]
MISYVTGFMFSKNIKNVALIKKIKPTWQKGLYNGIGGKVECNETASEAMAREFEEETGVKTHPDEWRLYTIITSPNEYEISFFFMISDQAYFVQTIEKEVVSIYQINQLPENTIWNLRWLIPLALDPKLTFRSPLKLNEFSRV